LRWAADAKNAGVEHGLHGLNCDSGMSSKLAIAERESGDVTILKLSGQLVLDDGDLSFRKTIHELVDRGRTKIVVDLEAVTYIDSAGIGMVVSKLKTLRERGGDMKLLNLNLRGLRVFGITKLMFVFDTFNSEEMAVKSFEFDAR
jgi:anti-anti-sigma factor